MVVRCPVCGSDTYYVPCEACSGGHQFCDACKKEFWMRDGQWEEVKNWIDWSKQKEAKP